MIEPINPIEYRNFINYLNFIQEKLDRFFEAQSPFIFCSKGCGRCCKNQIFPYSQIEIQNLIVGASKLDSATQKTIENNIDTVLHNKQKFDKNKKIKKRFFYDCPFLINNVCSIYEYRGIVCRAFGLMTKYEDDATGVPFCCFDGLNYSNVINLKTKKLSTRKYKKLKTEKTPNIYHVTYKELTDEALANGFGFKFGEIKPMIDWFSELKDLLKNQ